MPYINKERILSESPKKRLTIGFNKLKENYTKETALEYSELYKSLPLSTIIDNSRLIFSESYYGLNFYKDIINGKNEYCLFNSYINEKEKVLDFIEENKNKMGKDQISLYEELATTLVSKCYDVKNSISIVNYVCEKGNNDTEYYVNKIPDLLYEYSKTNDESIKKDINSLIKSIYESDSRNLFFVYSPYINEFTNDDVCSNIQIDDNNFTSTMESCLIVSKLYNDELYKEAINNIHNKFDRIIFESLANEPIKEDLDSLVTEKVDHIETFYSTPKSAVNRIFEDTFESVLFKEENDEYRNDRYGKRLSVLESMMELITYEYQTCDDVNDIIKGFNYFSEGTTIEEAFSQIYTDIQETKNILGIITEETDDNVDDKDIDELENDVNNNSDEEAGKTSKKVEAPKPKNKANAIQFKAMDAEVKQRKKMSEAKQKGQEVKNAAKAVAQLPMNVVNDIKDQVKKIDEADSTKRKKYMVEPGFRKKALRNLKLAITYGNAAKIKLSLVPVVALTRHWSKQKDRRVRNELISELQTEIKICDEKINDAGAAGDNNQKYELMRLRNKLENERTRVLFNSKHI